MSASSTCRAFALTALMFLLTVHATHAQQKEEWTWKDRDGKAHTRAELDRALKEHQLWVNSNGESGKKADLSGADLHDADLDSADLRRASLGGREVKIWSDIAEEFSVCHVEWTKPGANLKGARLSDADASDADMAATNLRDADLSFANFSNAGLEYASLVGARLRDTELKGANVRQADFQDAIF